MQITETIDLDDHEKVIDFLQGQSNRIKELEQREQQLLDEIKDFQELLQKNDDVCYGKVISLIDSKIVAIPKVYVAGGRYKIEQAYKDGYLRGLKDLRKELVE